MKKAFRRLTQPAKGATYTPAELVVLLNRFNYTATGVPIKRLTRALSLCLENKVGESNFHTRCWCGFGDRQDVGIVLWSLLPPLPRKQRSILAGSVARSGVSVHCPSGSLDFRSYVASSIFGSHRIDCLRLHVFSVSSVVESWDGRGRAMATRQLTVN